jgi:predicted PurR-regulated permease PerM
MPFSISQEQKQSAFWIGLWLLVVLLLVSLGPVLTPFIAAAILAYALNPGVDRLDRLHWRRLRVPRAAAVLLVMLVLGAALLALVLIVVPVLKKELPLLQDRIPVLLERFNALAAPRLHELGITVRLDGDGIRHLLTQQLQTSGEEIWRAVLNSARVGGSAVLGWLATLVLIPIVLFYLLLDWHPMLRRCANAIPRRWVGQTVAMAHEVDSLLAQYLRGQLLVMLVLAVYYSAGLMLAGFDVALPIGIITGLLVFIPYLGFGLGLGLALLAALLQSSGWQDLAAVAVVYGVGQVLESFILTPRLVGERIGMNPLAVIFALLAFGQLFGFVGILLALPISAILMVAYRHLRKHYLASGFYTAKAAPPPKE